MYALILTCMYNFNVSPGHRDGAICPVQTPCLLRRKPYKAATKLLSAPARFSLAARDEEGREQFMGDNQQTDWPVVLA